MLFAESLSLNSLLQLPSMRYCIRRNGQLSDTPYLSTGGSLDHPGELSPASLRESTLSRRASQRDFAVRSAEDSHAEEELSGVSNSSELSTSFDLYGWARILRVT